MIAAKQLEIELPCGVFYHLSNLILDLDGTLTVDGNFIEGVLPRLQELSRILNVYILTSDTNQTLEKITRSFGETADIKIHTLESGRGDMQKLYFLERIGREKTAAIGNGCNDVLILNEAALGICVIGSEGAAVEAIRASKALFLNICDALDIFLKRNRMIATLRK